MGRSSDTVIGRWRWALAILIALGTGLTTPGEPAPSDTSSPSNRLVWHLETRDGRVLDTREADATINPASVVKIATSLWALETLGPDHRFKTRFAARGSFDRQTGVLDGDLLVFGGRDPDFHVDNAYLVARALNRIGLREVRGRLLVDGAFWIGWEAGSQQAARRSEPRAVLMAGRLREALDPARWSRETRDGMQAVASRWGDPDAFEGVVVREGVGSHAVDPPDPVWLVHRSNRLRHTLKRFNAYSNNDIDRFAAVLGPPDEMTAMLVARWQLAKPDLRFDSLSGLGSNRMTPRQVVRLLRDLESACRRHDMALADLLPVAGCEPGTLRNYPGLPTAAVAAKTGTLARTDGGVAILAGLVGTRQGGRFFCVAAPAAGGRLGSARRAEVAWLLERIARDGGAGDFACGKGSGYSDDDASIETFIERGAD